MHCYLHREHRLRQALTDAGIGKDIMGSYDNGVYQPIFSVVAKNAEAKSEGRVCAGD